MGLTDSQPTTWLPVGVHGGRVTEEWDHVAIHKGQIHRVGSFATLSAGSALTITMDTGPLENMHAQFSISTNGPGLGYFYEDTIASGGTTVESKNANRILGNGSTAVVKKDPTVTTVGTQIGISVLGASGFRTVMGGTTESETWILKPSSTYMIRFTADVASTRTVLRVLWLED